MTYINYVLSTNNYQYTKVFQCDMSTFIYTNSLTITMELASWKVVSGGVIKKFILGGKRV